MMGEEFNNAGGSVKKMQRPLVLTILCIFSFIGSGLSGASFFMIYSSYDEVLPMLDEFSSTFPAVKLLATASRSFFLTGFLLYLFSITGVSLMWKLKKAGFHFYTGAQVMIVLLPVFFIKDFPLPFLDGLLSATFIAFYFSNYKLLT